MSQTQAKTSAALKRILVGRPMASGELADTLLPKTIALPIFSSDALSSVAYATQEILLVLALAGTAALGKVVPISFAVAVLLAMVVVSYRQTIRAYPSGGGAYVVAHENLGLLPGLLAGSSLLIDYVLTVAVSVVAGVDAIVSAAPGLADLKVELAILLVVFVALANLRGVRESGIFFAVPTYAFMLAIYALLFTGFVKCLSACPQAASADTIIRPESALTVFILLRAFAAGTTALTGVEAISNGVTAFRYPQSKNAMNTLVMMATVSISMFLGISLMARLTHVVYVEHAHQTVLAQIAGAVFHDGWLFYFVQITTALILILAANTAYAGFPRLASILAKDRFVPRQFMNMGDRLVYSNGIVILTVLASLLIWAFKANLNHLIQLYLVGVFVSFTLSQAGMVRHWRRTREPGWRRSAFINGAGAAMTGLVLCIVILTKFTRGAWIVVAAIPALIFMMRSIHSHYMDVIGQLRHPERRPTDRRPAHQHLVILAPQIHAATKRAIGYSRSVRPADIWGVTFDRETAHAWETVAPDIPISVLPGTGDRRRRLRNHLRELRARLSDEDFLTLVVPEVLESRSLADVIRRPGLHRLKASLLTEPGIQVLDVPVVREDIDESIDQAHEPSRHYVCVMVSGLHNATLQAIEYAETLQATDLRAITFGLDPEEAEALGDHWLEARIPHPLEVEASPFRDIGSSLVAYVRQQFKPDGIDRVVTVVLPEFVVPKRRHQVLHNQTALLVKRRLLFERGVVVVSVPYKLAERAGRESPSPARPSSGSPGPAR
jgi:amino acid transporter